MAVKRKKDTPPASGRTGRPSTYKPEYCQMLIDHMSTGLSFGSFGGEVGTGVGTLDQWAMDYPDFARAKAKGQAIRAKFYEDAARDIMTGKTKGAPQLAMFFLKNLGKGLSMTDKQEIEHTGHMQFDTTVDFGDRE